MKCMICCKKCKSLEGLRRHITLSHKDISYKEYYDKFLITDNDKFCKVSSCNNKTYWITKQNCYSKLCKECFKKRTLEVYIIRYGEKLGNEKYESMVEKNSYAKTLDGFISLYGVEEGTNRYNNRYKSEKSKCTLDGFILRYGKKEGTKRYNDYCSSVGTSLENLKRIYGEEEGTKRYNDFCQNTGVSLEKFKNLYGVEEGTKRYNSYLDILKGINTKERYKEKYGEDWEIEWNKTQSKKGTSLEKLQNLYGKDRGKEIFDSIYKDPKKRTSLEGFVLRYGNDIGKFKYDEYCEDLRFKNSEEYYIEKYGDGLGKTVFFDRHNNPKKKTDLNGFILRYGKKDGTKKYFKHLEKRGSSKEKFILRDGEELGNFKYNRYVKRVKKRLRNKMGFASKESMYVFFPVMDWLMESSISTLNQIKVGIKGSREWCLSSKKENNIQRVYFYDFTLPELKLIIEYNGEAYHPNPNISLEEWNNWKQPYSKKSATEVLLDDQKKINFAVSKGYKVLQLWSSDSIEYNINKCKNFILKELSNETNNRDII